MEELFLRLEIETDRAAGVHQIIRVEIVFQRADHAVFFFAEIALEPRCEHLADAVVVADRRAALLDLFSRC